MPVDVLIAVHEPTDVSAARRAALEVAGRTGLEGTDSGAVAIVVTEAATNLLKHAGGGDIIVRQILRGGSAAIEIIAIDRGKGMASPERCFQDGFSTAGSPGTGLGSISRLSRFHDIFSMPGNGTILVAHIGPRAAPNEGFTFGAISLPYPGESMSGDAWVSRTSSGRCRLMIADGLGHGQFACEAANRAVDAVTHHCSPELPVLMESVHLKLRATRGAAVAVADIDISAGTVSFVGVGNVAGSIVNGEAPRRQMVSMNGTVGHEMRKVQQYQYPFHPGSLLILHSDGVSTHWALEKYPGLIVRDPSVIAGVLLRDFRRTRDDATVVVVRAGEFRK